MVEGVLGCCSAIAENIQLFSVLVVGRFLTL